MEKLKRICSWCNRELLDSNKKSKVVSHGICEKCKEKLLSQIKVDKDLKG